MSPLADLTDHIGTKEFKPRAEYETNRLFNKTLPRLFFQQLKVLFHHVLGNISILK